MLELNICLKILIRFYPYIGIGIVFHMSALVEEEGPKKLFASDSMPNYQNKNWSECQHC